MYTFLKTIKIEVFMSEKIKILLIKKNLTLSKLAVLLGCTRQNLTNKIKRDNFSYSELKEIAKVLDVGVECNFILENGERI